MKLMLLVLEPLLLVNALLWVLVANSYVIGAMWIVLAIAMPRVARWVDGG